MDKILVTAILWFASQQWMAAQAQTQVDTSSVCHVLSLEGKKEKIIVVNAMNERNPCVQVIYRKDTIRGYENQYGEVFTEMIGTNFLKVTYQPRCGSGCGITNLLLFCIKNGKLYNSLFTEESSYADIGEHATSQELRLRLMGDAHSANLQLQLTLRDNETTDDSIGRIVSQHCHTKKTMLQFDNTSNIFCSRKQYLDRTFTVDDITVLLKQPKNYKYYKTYAQHLKGIFPLAAVGNETDYYIDGRWYIRNRNHLGTCVSHRK